MEDVVARQGLYRLRDKSIDGVCLSECGWIDSFIASAALREIQQTNQESKTIMVLHL